MDIHPGVVFGRYTIDAELGRGGMGRVVLAIDSVLHRKVALKILLPGLVEKEEVVSRFFREARLAAQLSHPNVAHIYDLGEVDGLPFIAMEHVDGKPLTTYLGDAFISVDRRMRWMADVARGLGAAHARGLLHRDVKPSNVMVGKNDVAKVVDFGLAKKDLADRIPPSTHAIPNTYQTAQGFIIGTPAYMAPEQLEGDDIDARADQFSWALTVYALIFGKNLRNDDPLLFGPIPLLCDRVAGVSRATSEIVLRALSHDRAMRFPSMEALLSELEPAVRATPSVPPTHQSKPPPQRPAVEDPPSEQITPQMVMRPIVPRVFCPDCGLSLAMPSPECSGPHAEPFPKMPASVSDE